MAVDTPDDRPTPPASRRADSPTEREMREAEDLALAASGLGSVLLKRQTSVEGDDSVAVLKVCPHCGTEYETAARFCPADGTSLRPKGSDSLIDRVLAERYHILKRIGEGGMGRVYLGEHVKMNRQCAIKVMNPALVNDHESATRFAREASSAARIIHPNVAAVFDFGESEGLVYLVMEFVDGEPLGRILAREAPLSVDRSVDLTRQIADGLGAAHELGIVHRDLKPDNILVARTRAGREVAKVVDFGIAKAMQESVGEALTRTGLVIGTPEFMSPEQLLGDPIDARSDLYALGCIMHLMLTAVPPFEAPTREQMIKRRLAEDAPHVQAIDPTLPDSLDRIVARLLARNPAERYGSAAEVRDALSGAHLRSSGAHVGIRPILRPTPRSAPTIAFASLQNATTEVHESTVIAPERATPPPADRRRRPLILAGGALAVGAAVLAVARMSGAPAEQPAVRHDSAVVAKPVIAVGPIKAPVAPARDTGPKKSGATSANGTTSGGKSDSQRLALEAERARKSRDSSRVVESRIPPFVRAAIAAYVRGIESRDMNRLKAAYPFMSGDQEEDWRKIFDRADSIRARVTYGGITATPTTIDAPFVVRLRIVDNKSRQATNTAPSTSHAHFTKDGNTWLLRSIEQR